MFTLTVHDERVYQQLMDRVEQRGESLDEVLRELLKHEQDDEATQQARNTPVRKLLKLIDAADLPFDQPFNARNADEILRRETGEVSWHAPKDDDDAS